MTTHAPRAVTDAQRAVERMIGEGTPFEHIEQFIETLELPSDHLSALWLLAWAEATDPVTRRRIVAETLAGSGELAGSPLAAAPSASARGPHNEYQLGPLRRTHANSTGGGWQRRGPDECAAGLEDS